MQDPVLLPSRPGKSHYFTTKPEKSLLKNFFQSRDSLYFKTSVFKESDISGFFAHDNHISIAHPTESQSSPMPQSHTSGNIPAIGDRKNTTAAKILFSLMITAPSCKGVFLKKIFSINSSVTFAFIMTPVWA